jgi:hypothetical protein
VPNYPYTNDETGCDDFDQPTFLEDEDDVDLDVDELEAYLLEKRIDRADSGMAGV